MTSNGIVALLPLIAVGGGTVLVILAIAVRRNHLVTFILTALSAAAALVLTVPAAQFTPVNVTPLLSVDGFSLFISGLLAAVTLTIAFFAYPYLNGRSGYKEEFYILLLTSLLGAAVLAAAIHYVSFFLGLEILSVSLYGLIAYLREEKAGIEGGIKYLILAGVSSAFLLFGVALIYTVTGGLSIAPLVVPPGCPECGVLAFAGIGLFIVGIGFKLALVPFHMWTPDVYQAAPLPVAALIATLSKGAVVALLLRFFLRVGLPRAPVIVLVFSLLAGASMLAGNLLALFQDNLKRLLAYSSIAHMGYLILPVLAGSVTGVRSVAFYLVAYSVTSLGAFGVLSVLSTAERETGAREALEGLAWRRPWLAGVLTLMLLSLAGLPLTAGFFGKFYLLAAGAEAGLWTLSLILVVSSAIGLFYYLRVIIGLFALRDTAASTGVPVHGGGTRSPSSSLQAFPPVPLSGGIALAVLTLALIWLGVYPAPLIRLIEAALLPV